MVVGRKSLVSSRSLRQGLQVHGKHLLGAIAIRLSEVYGPTHLFDSGFVHINIRSTRKSTSTYLFLSYFFDTIKRRSMGTTFIPVHGLNGLLALGLKKARVKVRVTPRPSLSHEI